VLVAIAVPIVAVAAGTLLALAGGARARVLVPVRSFALAAVLVAVVAHLLPEAIEAGGPWVLAVFAAGIAAPQLLGRLGKTHARVVTELGFIGVVLHQVGDGLVLGAVSDHWDVVIAIGAHTVPLAAAVALGIIAIRGRRAAIGRAAVLAAATIVGVVLASSGGPMIASDVTPWVNAAVAGLLVHLLSHDLPTPSRTGTEPLIEVLAIAAGVAIPLLAAHEHDGVAETLTSGLHELMSALAIPLAAGLAAAIALEHAGARLRARLLARGSAIHGVGAAALASACSCRVVPGARAAADHSRPAAIVAFLLAAPELGVDAVLVGGQLLGAPGTLIRLAAAVAIALIAGAVAARVAAGDHHDHDHDHAHDHDHPPASARSLLRTADEVIIHSGPWIMVGVVASVLVGVALPAGALAGSPVLAIVLAIVIAFPAYVCAAAATPLAAMLILRGLPPGAAIAGLILGAATNRAGLALIARHYGTAAAAAATGVALVIAIATGVAIQHGVAGTVGPGAPTAFGLPESGPVVTAALIVLGLAALRGLWRYGLAAWLEPLHGGEHHHHQHAEGAPCEAGCHDH
jgi:uncharacterized membrane protein YraQ (UPF0718 family)